MKILDTNVIVRFLLNDHPTQSQAAKKLLENPLENLLLLDIVIAEIIWLLTSYYKFPKQDVIEKIKSILNLEKIQVNKEVIYGALMFYQTNTIDFIDAYLAAYCTQKKNTKGVYSFDKDLDKIKAIKRFEP